MRTRLAVLRTGSTNRASRQHDHAKSSSLRHTSSLTGDSSATIWSTCWSVSRQPCTAARPAARTSASVRNSRVPGISRLMPSKRAASLLRIGLDVRRAGGPQWNEAGPSVEVAGFVVAPGNYSTLIAATFNRGTVVFPPICVSYETDPTTVALARNSSPSTRFVSIDADPARSVFVSYS